eukprot:5362717-Lingulodinium_polyedra.AAC.1
MVAAACIPESPAPCLGFLAQPQGSRTSELSPDPLASQACGTGPTGRCQSSPCPPSDTCGPAA